MFDLQQQRRQILKASPGEANVPEQHLPSGRKALDQLEKLQSWTAARRLFVDAARMLRGSAQRLRDG